jgi:hypothetical protein
MYNPAIFSRKPGSYIVTYIGLLFITRQTEDNLSSLN